MDKTHDSLYMGFSEVGYVHPMEGGLLGYLVGSPCHEVAQIPDRRAKVAD